MNQSKINTSATIQDFINSARHNACLLRQMIAAHLRGFARSVPMFFFCWTFLMISGHLREAFLCSRFLVVSGDLHSGLFICAFLRIFGQTARSFLCATFVNFSLLSASCKGIDLTAPLLFPQQWGSCVPSQLVAMLCKPADLAPF